MVPPALAWSLRQSARCLWPATIFYIPLRKVFPYMNISSTVIVGTRVDISTTTGLYQATCFEIVKTTIDPSTPISTTQIVQTNRHQTGLWLCHWSTFFR